MTTKTITISYRDFQKIRYYAGIMANDIDNMSADSADYVHKLCTVVHNIDTVKGLKSN